MRVFSKFEKQLLRRISDLEKAEERLITPYKILNTSLNIKSQVYIEGRGYDYDLKDGEVYYHKIKIMGNAVDFPNEYFEITGKFYETNDLLDYLLGNGYLLRYEAGKVLGFYINMQEDLIEKGEAGENVYVTRPLKEFLDKCSYYYKPTAALRDLVKHNFRTKAERNNLWTRIISIISIGISLLALAINFYVNSSKKDSTNLETIKLDTSSIDYFIKKSKLLNDTSSFKSSERLKDSL